MLVVRVPVGLLYRIISLLSRVAQMEPDDHPWPAQAVAINDELRERIRAASEREESKRQ